MTALCGGGASTAKPGLENNVTLTGTAVAAALTVAGFSEAAAILGALIGGLNFELNTFCAIDPPADPVLTASDIANAINFSSPELSIPAVIKIKTWFESQYWYDVCQCSTTNTPAPPAPSNPGGISVNPGLPQATSGPCSQAHTITTLVHPVSGTYDYVDLSATLLPFGATRTVNTSNGVGFPVQAVQIPSGVTAWGVNASPVVVNPSANDDGVLLSFYGATGSTPSLTATLVSHVGGVGSATNVALPSGSAYWAIYQYANTGPTGTFQYDVQFMQYCGGVGLQAACCPPDPNIDSKLNQILGMVQEIYSIIPVRVPNYAAGAAHTGLSGGGTLAIADTTIAIKVEITTLPVAFGEIFGTPDTYLDVGWLTPVNNEGPTAGVRISRSAQTFALPEATSAIDYSLPPGEIISISELQAG